MRTIRPALTSRHRHNLWQFGRFSAVGASGVAVNLIALVLVKRLGPHPEISVLPLPPTDFHVRWYHLYSTAAFVVANLWNFQLNRMWTFRSSRHSRWWREYWPFLAVGLLGQVVGLILLTLLMHRGSPLALPTGVLDDSTGLRTRLYWAQLIVILVVTPLSFVLNKVWTFAAVRTHRRELAPGTTPGDGPAADAAGEVTDRADGALRAASAPGPRPGAGANPPPGEPLPFPGRL